MKKRTILLVDDDLSLLRVMEYNLAEAGYNVIPASTAQKALDNFKEEAVDLVITDLKMPDGSGIELLTEIKRLEPQTLVIVITAFGTIDTAVEAIRKGAYDYITKPFSRDELTIAVKKAFRFQALLWENILLHQELMEKFSFESMVGGSEKMTAVFQLIRRLTTTDTTVLIQGESGTGKELVARAIHYHSPRAPNNFVAVNCSSIPDTLLESELFGHTKGAFTGAVSDRQGKFELADDGTIFLDEIGDLRLDLQGKLLRVLQERQIDKLGNPKPIDINVRVIAATSHNLEKAVEQGNFRSDLYYRINVVSLTLPALRERKEDIPLLVQHFLHKFGGGSCRVEPEVMNIFQQYHWPGNVRELENVIERAVVLRKQKECIVVSDLPENLRIGTAQTPDLLTNFPDKPINLEELEKSLILTALEKTDWNQTRAAELLGITRQTLIYRIEKFGLKKTS